jgi:hypothetical protein
LLDVKIILHRTVRHVTCEHQKRRPAFRRFGNPRERVCQPRAGMDADQRQFAARFGIGVGHARRITLLPRGNELDAGLHQRVGDFEIGGAEQGKAAPRAIAGEVGGDHVCDNRIAFAHALACSGFWEKPL